MAEEKRDPLEYVINRMENAGHSQNPAANGYGKHRKDLLDGIAALRAEVAQARNQALEEAITAAQPYGGTGIPEAIRALKVQS